MTILVAGHQRIINVNRFHPLGSMHVSIVSVVIEIFQ